MVRKNCISNNLHVLTYENTFLFDSCELDLTSVTLRFSSSNLFYLYCIYYKEPKVCPTIPISIDISQITISGIIIKYGNDARDQYSRQSVDIQNIECKEHLNDHIIVV